MAEKREQKVYDLLEDLNVSYALHTHPPVYTVEQAVSHWKNIKGAHCKNIFVRNKKGNRHFLIIVEHKKTVDLKTLAQKLGQSRLSFASPERMKTYLGLEPGSVSPFGLVYDKEKNVSVVIDKDLRIEEFVNFHPNVNTATLTLSFSDFQKFLAHCGQSVIYMEL
jgi:Ala-tRNA(Pro) deacylase